jgi:hypothetical protein
LKHGGNMDYGFTVRPRWDLEEIEAV